jgi:hypothetical protein
MGLVVVGLEEEGVVAVSSDVLDADADADAGAGVGADVVDDKPIPLKASVRSDTPGRHASTSKRRSTLSVAKSWMKQTVKRSPGLC